MAPESISKREYSTKSDGERFYNGQSSPNGAVSLFFWCCHLGDITGTRPLPRPRSFGRRCRRCQIRFKIGYTRRSFSSASSDHDDERWHDRFCVNDIEIICVGCWKADPADRPDFHSICHTLAKHPHPFNLTRAEQSGMSLESQQILAPVYDHDVQSLSAEYVYEGSNHWSYFIARTSGE